MKVSAAQLEVLMVLARCSVVTLAALALLACSSHDLTAPADTPDDLGPSFAKKEAVKVPVIQEYWVIPGETGNDSDMIHLVVSDAVRTVRATVVYDYFHNGLRDDDPPDDQHFELSGMALPGAEVEDLGGGWAHLDIPWDGTIDYRDPDAKWPDHLSIEIPGEGDPYVFELTLIDAKGDILDRVAPRGIVVAGVEAEPPLIEESPVGMGLHEAVQVRSYATFEGLAATGSVSLSELSATGVVCETETVTTGKGKNRVVEYRYRLSAQLTVAIAVESSEDHVWWEGHFRSIDTDVLSARMVGMGAETDATATVVMPTEWNGEGEVEFVVDLLSSSDPGWRFVYDPWDNVPLTTAGFDRDGAAWGDVFPSNQRTGLIDGMYIPVAHSDPVTVSCK